MVASVETLGTTTLKGPLPVGFPASELVSHGRTLSNKPSTTTVMANVLSLVACMADPHGGKLRGRSSGGRRGQEASAKPNQAIRSMQGEFGCNAAPRKTMR